MGLNPRIASWAGRRVWVIGASSGIGRATAALLHARGAQVVVSARGESALNQFTQAHPGSVAVALDSTDAKAVQAAADGLRAQGPLHLVCYCAGIYESQSAADFDLAAMLRHDDVKAVNTEEKPDEVSPRTLSADPRAVDGERFRSSAAPLSWNLYRLTPRQKT